MLGKKFLIPIVIVSLLSFNLVRFDAASAAPVSPVNSRNAEAIQLQQQLNNNGFWIGAVDGILSSKAYQAVVKFETDINLVADGLIGLQTRQTASVALIDSALNPAAVMAESSVPPAETSTDVTSRSDTGAAAAQTQKTTAKAAEETTSTVSRGTTSSRTNQVLTMVATGYDGCYECNKPYYGYPSYVGLPLKRGIVAVDPRIIPMWTRLYVEGYGEAIAADQGNAIKGNRIDLFFDSHQEALNWGIKTVKVTILGK